MGKRVMSENENRAHCERMDLADPLAHLRDAYRLPSDLIYLDGNSLGPLPKALPARMREVVETEWGEGLIRSWNAADWMTAPTRIGDMIAPLIGAEAGEVVCADSTSVNLFKMLAAALPLNPDRRVILTESDNFPTDMYIMQGLIDLLDKDYQLRRVSADRVSDALSPDVAVLALAHVNYKTGRIHDMAAVTAAAHEVGTPVVWDLAHSAGAVPVDLRGAKADFAVGCGYKYLNGGPGAPAFVYVRRDLQDVIKQPLSGWLGHRAPFDFAADYEPAPGIDRNLAGTPPVLSLLALECALEIWQGVDMGEVRLKSIALTDLFIRLVEKRCAGHDLQLASPRDPDHRGSQVSFRHANGYPIMQALIAAGVIGDFRAPDLMRFGFAPHYVRFVDVWDAVTVLADILTNETWRNPQFAVRAAVT